MAKKENKYKGYDITTQAIHTGTDYDEGTGAVRRPLHMANSYKLPDDLSQVNYSSTDLLMYSRNGNLNTALTDKLYINGLVISNTDAEDDVEEDRYNEFTEYDFTYSRLEKNLEKEVNGK